MNQDESPQSRGPELTSPYREAWQWIERNPGTDSARSLAKLLLSLWNQSNAFSFRECVDNLDEDRTRLALSVAIHFASYGEDRELLEIGARLCQAYPRLWELGLAATEAKREMQEKWRADAARAAEGRADLIPALSTAHSQAIRVTFDVPVERHEAFMRMWLEFVTGDTPHDQTIRERAVLRNQGIASLREFVGVAQRRSGQCRYIARFLAGLYNGPRFPFDLTDLRAIDDELFEHAIAVLRLDHRPAKEVHCYFSDGSELWEERIIKDWDLDKQAALHAALLLASYLEDDSSQELRQLGGRLSAWRRENDPQRL